MMRDIYHIDRAARERILDEQTRKRIKQNWADTRAAVLLFLSLLLVGLSFD